MLIFHNKIFISTIDVVLLFASIIAIGLMCHLALADSHKVASFMIAMKT